MRLIENLLLQSQMAIGILSKYTIRPAKFINAKVRAPVAHPFKIVWVDPNNINYISGNFTNKTIRYGGRFSVSYFAGATVRKGEWDLERKLIEQSPKYQSVKQHFVDGTPWEKTPIFDILSSEIKAGKTVDGCTSIQDLVQRYQEIDNLHTKLLNNGFRADTGPDHITVNIGRHGELLFNGNGYHRLSIAKVENFDEIPVRILIRHTEWQKYRNNLCKNSDSEVYEERLKNHPDLQRII